MIRKYKSQVSNGEYIFVLHDGSTLVITTNAGNVSGSNRRNKHVNTNRDDRFFNFTTSSHWNS